MLLRPATIDDAFFIATGFHTAMLYEDTPEERLREFAERVCTREDVLYSWTKTTIAEIDGRPVAMLTSYDGADYHETRVRTQAIIKDMWGTEFPGMEDEALPGEYYLDSLAVLPEYRGQGIGRRLLEYGIEEGKRRHLLTTLAVDPVNERAQRLYQSLGFRYDSDLFIFGHTYWKYTIPCMS